MEKEGKCERPANPRAKANILSILTFGWTLDLFRKGAKRDLLVNDLYETLDDHASSTLGNSLDRYWSRELINSKKYKRAPSLLRAVTLLFGPSLMLYGMVLAIVEIVLSIFQPLCIRAIIEYYSTQKTIIEWSIFNDVVVASLLLVALSFLRCVLIHWVFEGTVIDGMRLRVATCSLIYKKTLRLSKTALGETTIGQVVNLLSNDVNRFDIAVIFLHYLWIGPLETIVVTYFLWNEIGPSSIIGVAVLLLFIPLQGWLGKTTSKLRLNAAIRTDERVRLMNEIITGIQVIKMYTWEKPFASLVSAARRKEIKEIRGTSYIRGMLVSFIIFHSRTALFFSIFAYVLSGNTISAAQVFVITSYFNILRQTMTVFFPQGIGQIAEAYVSLNRLQKFLLYEENEFYGTKVSSNGVESDLDLKPSQSDETKELLLGNDVELVKMECNKEDDTIAIAVVNARAKWSESVAEDTLHDLNITVAKGTLLAVIGPVGSGKSSLIQGILHELPLQNGYIHVRGSISYASQEPWLFAGSVRQNILFGLPMDKERYKKVIKVCALKADFEQLVQGDQTVVGERGASLSGGQRARVNLARAVYKEADVYLLDDPLSAVDAHVGKHLFEDCITGFLKDKTVVLVTHQLQYLSSVDHILLLQQGSVSAEGTYQALQETGLDFTNLLSIDDEQKKEDEEVNEGKPLHSRQVSVQSVASSLDDGIISKSNEAGQEEITSKGSVGAHVYTSYFAASGHCIIVFFMFFMCCFAQFLASGSDAWITYWVNMEETVYPKLGIFKNDTSMKGDNDSSIFLECDWYICVSRDWCVYIFGLLTLLTIIVTMIRSYAFVQMCMNISMNLHNTMFNSITRATMLFFNTNPSGRILNRFSKDMGSVDEVLPTALMDCIQIGLTLLAIVIVLAFVNIWLLVPTILISYIFYCIRTYYVATSRSVKRLEGITRSPVFSHLSASLQGLTTIRAFGAQNILINEFDNHQDLHSSAWYLFLATSRAFGFWLDMICVLYIAVVTFSFFLIQSSGILGGNVGLAITQAIGLTGMFQWGMRQSAELENQMTSVERVLEYNKLPKEAHLESPPDKKPPSEWPTKGEIIFNKLFLRYSPDGPFVLRNLNFTIVAGEKVGIVGRTGAGKSSLIGALFRLAFNEGEILIDNIDIHTLGLHEVRSKISIIPQEPVLFSGTLRKNLDPFDEYADHKLWDALQEVELKDAVDDLSGGLNSKIMEGGSNFSVGQRQLVCLARAIVRNNRILVLDEATANVDPQTDALIQKTIRQKFRSCTVLTIAHRLNTVMDSDKVIVMDAGTCVEYSHPYILLQNKESMLSKMLESTGKTNAQLLYTVAAQSYEKANEENIPYIDAEREWNVRKN